MSEYVTLMGAEQIANAGQAMRQAADTMSNAASNLDGALERHQRFMDDWLCRLENILSQEDRLEGVRRDQ